MNENNTNVTEQEIQAAPKKSVKKKVLGAASVVCALGLLAGTFAWFTKTQSKDNVFSTDTFNTSLVDVYDPIPVTPGADITKEVGAVNNGQTKVVVRMKLNEKLQTLVTDENGPVITKADSTTAAANQTAVLYSDTAWKSLTVDYTENTALSQNGLHVYTKDISKGNEKGTSYLAYFDVKDGKQVVEYTPAKAGTDTTSAVAASVKYEFYTKNAEQAAAVTDKANIDKLIQLGLNVKDWTYNADGYFYYNKVLNPGDKTVNLVSNVKFDSTLGNSFAGATYTLTPTMEVTQANVDAVKDIFKVQATFNQNGTVSYGAISAANEVPAASSTASAVSQAASSVA
ncbi:MAG: hypothetical protein E7572_07745 [Ruminococcaceae bacterium]|jgi:alternate signal-mediated exported protein|nr:hypothetical protein [Oscillospiraceae bacterium]